MLKRSLVQLLLCIVDTFAYRLVLLISLRYFVHSGALLLTALTLCKGLGFGLEVQSLGLGLDQKGLVLVLGNLWSLGLGLETKVLVLFLVLKKKSYLHLCLTTWYAVYLYLFAQGVIVLHCILTLALYDGVTYNDFLSTKIHKNRQVAAPDPVYSLLEPDF